MPISVHECQALFSSAHKKGISAAEAEAIFLTGFKQCAEVEKEVGAKEKSELFAVWAIALTGYCRLKKEYEEKQKILDEAQPKFNVALQGVEDKFPVLLNWGSILLDLGEAAKSASRDEKSSVYLTQACSHFQQAFLHKQDSVELIRNWRWALVQHSEMTTGHAKMWFDTRIAEKDRWFEMLRHNEVPPKPERLELSPPEKLYKGIEEKEKGNDYFKKGELQPAMKHYYGALNYANGLYGLSVVDERALKDLKVSVYNNMSLVHQKQGKPDKAIADLNLVLSLDADNLKALFRRGKLYHSLGNIDKARADLDKAKELSPTDADVTRELQALSIKEKQQAEASKRVYSKMFA